MTYNGSGTIGTSPKAKGTKNMSKYKVTLFDGNDNLYGTYSTEGSAPGTALLAWMLSRGLKPANLKEENGKAEALFPQFNRTTHKAVLETA